jgi:iron complex outermembrane receptor protein
MICRSITLLLSLLPVVASAQDAAVAERETTFVLPPVIIRATEAVERLSPVTFSNLGKADIAERYSFQDIPVLLAELPSATSYSENGNGVGYNYVTLRGFDQRRLSVMINGVPQNDPEDHNVYWIDFPDLLGSADNIQVQRGAGSAFYGPPAIGGSINLTTNPFARPPGITIESLWGFQEDNTERSLFTPTVRKQAITASSGLLDNRYLVYGRLGRIRSEGYRENAWVNMDSYFLGLVRVDPNMTTRIHLYGGPITDGLAYYGLPAFVNGDESLRRENLAYWESDGTAYTYAQPRRPQETESFSQPHAELIHDWRIGDSTIFHNTIFLVTGEGYFDYDASWADTSMLRLGNAYGIPASGNPANTLVRAFVGNLQWGWLPRVEFQHGSGTLTAGAELRFHRSVHWGKIAYAENLPAGFDPDYHFYEYEGRKEITSIYAHELFRPSPVVSMMFDLQLVANRYGIHGEKYLDNDFTTSYLFANVREGINLNLSDAWNAYVSFAYTSREPRLRNLYAAEDAYFGATPQFQADTSGGMVRYDFTRPLARPERLVDLELGTAFRTPAGRIAVNGFLMEFHDELVKEGQVDIFGQPVTGNASRTLHVGLEVDWQFTVGERLTVEQNFSLSRNRLRDYTVIDNGAPVKLDGNPIAGFPDLLANSRVTYRDTRWTIAVATKYVGDFYTDNFQSPSSHNDAFVVWNADAALRFPVVAGANVTLRTEVRNIFNQLYFTSGEGNAYFPAAERTYVAGILIGL